MADAALVVNPHTRLSPIQSGGSVDAILVNAPVKGKGLVVHTVDRQKEPGLFGVLLVWLLTRSPQAVGGAGNTEERARLLEIGALVPADHVSQSVQFVCDVENLPTDFVSRRSHAGLASSAPGALQPSSHLEPLGEGGPSAEMRGRLNLSNPFRRDRSWFLAASPGLSAPGLYSSSHADVRSALAAAGAAASPLLADAGVLTSPALDARARQTRAGRQAAAHRELVERRYTVLPDLIRPVQLAAIRRYYRDLIAEGFVQYGDQDWPNRYFAKRDALAYCFHQQLTAVISEVAGEPVKPSFAFLASYCPGSVLAPHKDREQCHYSVSILIDHQPEPDDVSPWPIFVQPPGDERPTPIHAGLGDGLLYFGEEVLHYREPLTAGQSTLWFFFYVPERFEGSLD